jgi:UDP:flavonoid glycosyltransferase YjiC (YdhE family)
LILFAWELGGNYGHLSVTVPIARQLQAAGHEIIFALRDLRLAAEILTPAGIKFLPAPAASTKAWHEPVNYADILLAAGLGDEFSCRGLMQGWDSLLDLLLPQVIVADHAPFALIAARARATPAIGIGSGFTVPPIAEPLPTIRPWEKISHTMLVQADAAALESLNAYLSTNGTPALTRLCDLFTAEPPLLTTFPELDHYGVREQGVYLGPPAEHPGGSSVAWLPCKGSRIFAYLRPSTPHIRELLVDLEEYDAQVICVMPQADAKLQKHFEESNVRIISHRVQLAELFNGADLVISNAGTGMIATALLAGLPMLLVPQTVEEHLGALRVKDLGAAIVIPAKATSAGFLQQIEHLLGTGQYREAASRFAARHASFDREASTARAAAAIVHAGERQI